MNAALRLREPPATAAQRVVAAAFVGFVGIAAVVLWQVLLVVPASVLVEGERLPTTATTAIGTVALGLGMATAAGGYLAVTDRDPSFVDVRLPDLRAAGYAVLGVFGLFGGLLAVQLAFQALGVQASSHSLADQARGDPTILLVLIPASWLLVGPGEELLFRNVVQKSLYEAFSRPGAVAVASVVFAAVHFQAYLSASLAATVASLALVFVLSLVLGTVYAATDNILVPAFVHGTFNGVQFTALYVTVACPDAATARAAATCGLERAAADLPLLAASVPV